jgi:peptidoglycan hydrolase-like protein with peptidoglycan-binding domain
MSGSHYGASSMDSSTVRQVQQALADKGHNPGPIDGMMGPRTRAALKSYQRQQNLSGASGLDQQTLNSLGVQASASSASGSMASSGSTRSGMGSASGSNASTGTASDGGPNSRNPSNKTGAMAGSSDSTHPGVKTPSGSNASTGTASDGGPNSRNPSNVPGSTASKRNNDSQKLRGNGERCLRWQIEYAQ